MASELSRIPSFEQSMSSGDEDGILLALSELVKMLGTVISHAHDVAQVTNALHLLASLLFTHSLEPIAGNSPAGRDLDELASACRYKANLIVQGGDSMEALRRIFYGGSSFPAVAKLLLFRVAPDWLACFSSVEQTYLFDSFFTFAPPREALMALVPALIPAYHAAEDGLSVETSSLCAVAERLLTFCLIENCGLRKMVLDCASTVCGRAQVYTNSLSSGASQTILTLAQLIASIPDKARPNAPASLHSPSFYLSAASQLLEAAEGCWMPLCECTDNNKASFHLIGEVFARFCRRGHADIVASRMLPTLLQFIKKDVSSEENSKHASEENPLFAVIEDHLQSSFWAIIMASMRDAHAVEKLTNVLLLDMAHKQVKDWEAYCILCVLFSDLVARQASIRSMFTEKFLLWKVFPIRCLRWILHFVVLCCPPGQSAFSLTSRTKDNKLQINVIRHIIEVWAGESFIQSCEMQQQAYVSAAIGLSLRGMKKEDLESSNNLLQLLLQGISCRLESPLPLVRAMAKRVALAFSLVIDQANPLLIDEDDKVEDLSDWDQLASDRPGVGKKQVEHRLPKLESLPKNEVLENDMDVIPKDKNQVPDQEISSKHGKVKKVKSDLQAYDPDEVIDLGTYVSDGFSDEDAGSESGSDTSLQPYDLSDDESDLERDKLPMKLSDCAVNLRKGDQPELVEGALEVSEKLVRAMPDELENFAPDLAHALIHVRCSAIAVEGHEESAENKRQSALVALLVCAPQTVQVLTQELYSAHVDVSQRLLVLEVMSCAARELATGSVLEPSAHGHGRQLIGEISDTKWYGPSNKYAPIGAGPWKEINDPNAMVSLIHKYERELPKRPNSRALGKSRRWGYRSMELREQQRNQTRGIEKRNLFTPFAASFMLPVMRDYDKKKQGVDFLGRDFIVLGRLICMLGVCIECVSLHPEASLLAPNLLNMLSSKKISNHPEAYVRRATLYAASRIMVSLHPSHVATALNVGDFEIAGGLDWIRAWALQVAENDSDAECCSMAMACLHLHSELVLQASRSMESERESVTSAGSITYKHDNFKMIL